MIRLLLLGLIATLISACSATSLLYNNADWLLKSRMDSYFALTSGQLSELDLQLTRLHLWHRQNELPRYANSLNALAENALDGLTQSDIETAVDKIEALRQSLAVGVIPDLARFLSRLETAQIDHYDDVFKEEIAEDRELAEAGFAQRQRTLADELISRLEHWVGPMDYDQRSFVQSRFQQLPDYQPLWLSFRLQRHQALMDLLRTHPGRQALEQQLSAWWKDRQAAYPTDYRQSRQSSRNALIHLLADLATQLGAEQRQYLLDQLRSYSDVFKTLAVS